MKKYIKIHGLQRSGTNYVTTMLKENFKDVQVSEAACGSKHGPIYLLDANRKDKSDFSKFDRKPKRIKEFLKAKSDENLYFLIVIKEPVAWMLSIAKWYSTWVTLEGVKEWIKTYNKINGHYISMSKSNDNVMMIPYESWIDDYKLVLQRIGAKFNLEKLNEDWSDHVNVIRPKLTKTKSRFNKGYYYNKRYMKSIDPKIVEYVYKNTLPSIMNLYRGIL